MSKSFIMPEETKRYWKNTLPLYLGYFGLLILYPVSLFFKFSFALELGNFIVLIGVFTTVYLINQLGEKFSR